MASEWYDYFELKNYLYTLWKDGEWDKLCQDIKRVYWNNLQQLLGEANAGMEIGSSDESTLCILQPVDDDGSEKARKKRIKGNYLHAYSIEWAMENGIDYPCLSTPEAAIIQQETNSELYAAIGTLDGADQKVVVSYYFEDLKERQIGAMIGMKQKTVNNHKKSSLKKLLKVLEKNQ